jgi:photosystem II stability/assembly factor-like uncharacterized protein
MTTTLTGVTFGGAGYAWACGLHATILRSTDGGSTWTALSSPLPDEEVSDIEFVSPTTGWAVGVNNAILRSTNGGASWSAQVFTGSLYAPYLLELSAVDATHAWIGGYYTSSPSSYHNVVLRTTNGTSWQMSANLQLDGAGDWGVTGLSFPDRLHGWAAISGGYYAFSNDGGAVWTPPIDVSTASFFNDVSFADATHGWAVGQDSSYNGFIMHTANGTDWHRQADSVTLPEVRAVFAVSQSVAWAACADGYVMKTEDGGETWVYQQRAPGIDLNAVACPSANVAVVVGDQGTIIRYGDPYKPPRPTLGKLKPASGRVRSTVTLSGHGFGALRDGASSVKFGAKKAPVKSWSDTQIKVTVPAGTPRGYVKVKVTTAGGVSGAKRFLRK